MTTRAVPRPLPVVLAALLGAATLAACGRDGTHEITRVVERTDAGPPAPEATPERRFRAAAADGQDPHAGLSLPPVGAARAAAGPADPGAPDATPSPFTWTAPPEWTRSGALPMRLATYVPTGAKGTAIAVSRLPGRAGGVRLNLDRWRSQLGLPPLSDAEFDALPRATILGGAAVFLAADGRYEGMSGAAGAEAKEGARLVAVAVERAQDMVFVKMTGPADEVRGEEARFRAFCESLRE